MYPPGLEFIESFLACLLAGIIAVPAYPPRRNRSADRLRGIIEDAKPSLILTTQAVTSNINAELLGQGSAVPCLATDLLADDEKAQGDFAPPALAHDSIAFLQYTSGSTGNPRGVIITHENIVSNELMIEANFGHTKNSVVISWLPVFHDMGLIGGVLQPLFVGFPSILLAPFSFVKEPIRWLRAIAEHRGTTTGAPNSAWDHAVKHVTQEMKAGLDLSSLCVAYNGAEPVRAETLRRFSEAFSDCGFRPEAFFPCYGLAESTLFVAGGPVHLAPVKMCVDASELESSRIRLVPPSDNQAKWLVSSGKIAPDTTIVIADVQTGQPCGPDKVGEIRIHSKAVAKGYRNRPDESDAVFGNRVSCKGQKAYLRTGDLGFVRDGELFVAGRLKDIIILRGRNVYPQDVESAIESALPSIGANCCAAFAVEFGEEEKLAAVVEADRDLTRAARDLGPGDGNLTDRQLTKLWGVVDTLCQRILSEIEIAVQTVTFVRPGTFLRTSSGKVRRGATRAALLAGSLDIVFAWDAGSPGRLSRTTPFSSFPQLSGRN
ncbi:fatty acyl-AMP ligase [soil metagenome]